MPTHNEGWKTTHLYDIHTSFYSFVRDWSFSGEWETDGGRQIKIAILTHIFFLLTMARHVIFKTKPSTSTFSRPWVLKQRPEALSMTPSLLSPFRHQLTRLRGYLHISFYNAYNFRLDHVIFCLFTQEGIWLVKGQYATLSQIDTKTSSFYIIGLYLSTHLYTHKDIVLVWLKPLSFR